MVDLRAESMGAIALAKDFKDNTAMKHIDVAYNVSSDFSTEGCMVLSRVRTTAMVADGMKKPLDPEKLMANVEM